MAACAKCGAPLAYEGAKCGACVARARLTAAPSAPTPSPAKAADPAPELGPVFCDRCGVRVPSRFPLCAACLDKTRAERARARRVRWCWATAAGACAGLLVAAIWGCAIVERQREAERAERARQAAIAAGEAQRLADQRAAVARAEEEQKALLAQQERAAAEQEDAAAQRARDQEAAQQAQAWEKQLGDGQRAWEQQLAQTQAAEQQRAAAAAREYVLVAWCSDSGAARSNEFMRPSAGHHFSGIRVVITNCTSSVVSVSPFSFSLRCVESNVMYPPAFADARQPLQSCELGPGGAVSGDLVFEVPNGTRRISLHFDPMDPFRTYRVICRAQR
jgi:hypothetical protein